jgi:alpha-glucan,water dikinase
MRLKYEKNTEDFIRPGLLLRLMLFNLGKGANEADGQRVRDDILKIQQKNNLHGNFYEQWHQKLHNNSTPDDIFICEGVLNFLKNGGKDLEDFWGTLRKHNITKERLANFERKISKHIDINKFSR